MYVSLLLFFHFFEIRPGEAGQVPFPARSPHPAVCERTAKVRVCGEMAKKKGIFLSYAGKGRAFGTYSDRCSEATGTPKKLLAWLSKSSVASVV